MPSRENTIISVCASVAVTAAVGIDTIANVPDWLPLGLLLGLGVIVPLLVNTAFDSRETA